MRQISCLARHLFLGVAFVVAASPANSQTVATRVAYDPTQATRTVAFWEARAKRDPQGFLEFRELAGALLARQRETGDVADAVKAEAAARKSLAISQRKNATALIRLGRALLTQHRFTEALEAAEQAMAQDPQAGRLVCDIRIELGDYDGAEQALDRESPVADDLNELALRARLDDIRGRRDSSLRRWREARRIVDERLDMPVETAAWVHAMLGHSLIDSGLLEEGESCCRTALAIFPRDYRAMTGLAEAAVWRKNWKDSAEWSRKAIEICPQNPEALRILGESLAGLGDVTASAEQYRKLEELCGSFKRIYDRHWIHYCADEGIKLDDAVNLAREDLKLRPDVFAHDALAWALFKKGSLPEAEKEMKLALAEGTQAAPLYQHAGMIAKAAGDRDRALAYLAHAKVLNPYIATDANKK